MPCCAVERPAVQVALESRQSLALTLPDLRAGMGCFFLTHGQWSMADIVRALVERVGPADISLWPRLVAVSRGDFLMTLCTHPGVRRAVLVLNTGDERANHSLVRTWQQHHGLDTVRHTRTHAKIATVRTPSWAFLLRGSLNMGVGVRFEQCDLTEGGADCAMVRAYEAQLPCVEEVV